MLIELADEHKLYDTYNVGIMVANAKAAMIRYDMNDVFMLIARL